MEYKNLPDLKALATLREIVESGGVAEAGRVMNIGQPAVTKRLRTLGSDLGSAVKGFRSAMNEAEEKTEQIGDSSKDADFDNTPAEETRQEKDA